MSKHPLRHKVVVAYLFVAALLLPMTGYAQSSQLQILEQKIKERDKVILELIDRVEALEKRTGSKQNRPPRETTASNTTTPTKAAPGKVVVDAATAERALERSLAREGALLLSKGYLEIEPRLFFARREDRSVIGANQIELNSTRLSAQLDARLGLPWDSQLEIGLPYRFSHVETGTNTGFTNATSSTGSGSGFGDLSIGIAKTLFREDGWRPDLIARLTWDTDTGPRTNDGVSLGGGFHELQGSLTAIKRQDPMVFIGRLSHTHTFQQGAIQPGGLTTVDLGTTFALSPETSMRFFFSGGYQDELEINGSPLTGSDQVIGRFTVGTSTLLAPGILANISLGVGLTDDTDDYSLTVSFPIRFNSPVF